MSPSIRACVAGVLLALLPGWLPAAPVVKHELQVRVDPDSHQLQVRDRLLIPAALVRPGLRFTLHADLQLQGQAGHPALQPVRRRVPGEDTGMDREDATARVPVNVYRLPGLVPGRDYRLELHYQGRINHPVRQLGAEYARGFAQSPGLIEARGVYLAGSTQWVPQVDRTLLRYTLDTELPAGWKTVSQGERLVSAESGGKSRERWQVKTPTEEIYLIAARFTETSRDIGQVKAMAFLRKPDAALAERYLETTGQYLQMYRDLLGDYPYGKFALVENFWETGYGMPSFTLLGEQIIRFPFILHSSYPHELLHNWWGNGVFVDFSGGNWCEGLTAYLADHLIAEQRGLGSEHRRDILQRVSDFVTPDNDFPLRKFQGRFDAVSEAVGYGKTAMLWNMLREKIGDKAFVAGLQAFYRQHLFALAGFDDLRQSFEAVSGRPLAAFFEQWVQQPGTPELRLQAAAARGQQLDLTLSQVQPGRLFAIDLPVAVQTAAGLEWKTVALSATQREQRLTLDLKAAPLRVQIDPQFQVYRRLSPLETPPALSRAFGAKKVLIVMPGRDATLYADLVQAWRKDGVEVVADSALQALPADRAVWVLGADNRHADALRSGLPAHGAALDAQGALRIGDDVYANAGRSVVATLRHPDNPASVIVYLSAPSAAAATALARKLPHYGKYSWLVFAGDAADNEAKGSWPVRDTPLSRELVAGAPPLQLKERKALAELKPLFDTQRLKADVDWLAHPDREGRGVGTAGLDAAAEYIAQRYAALGLKPWSTTGDNPGYFQPFSVLGPGGQGVTLNNVLGVAPGSNPAFAGQALVISAHYDHLGLGWPDARAGAQGQLHPGADDNASGVAVLLELARLTAAARPERSVIFVAFSGEEAGLLGSRHYVKTAAAADAAYPLARHIADLNVDTVGRLEGGKISVFGAASAREWPFIFMGAGAVTGVPVQVVTQALDGSDHTAFIEAGVPAVQLFASVASDYHRPSDSADKIDQAGLLKVAAVLKEAADYLAARPEPLSFAAAATATTTTAAVPGARQAAATSASRSGGRAATGVVPDMAYEGQGVRVASITPGSGAEQAGLRPGDRLLSMAGRATPDLRALSEVLRELRPGQRVAVEYQRDAARLSGQLVLGER